ncbi:MAG: restriction endonuclease subunit R, partial [Cyanobacteria bacterium P01_A01_bin.37]
FFQDLCPENRFFGQLKDDFMGYVQRGIKEFIREEIENLLYEAAGRSTQKEEIIEPEIEPEEQEAESNKKIEFTDDEREGYYILKSILREVIDVARITYKDTASYCNILLDGNTWKQIVRLHFNNKERKKLEIFSIDEKGNKSSEMIPINNLNEIYKYADKFKEILASYENLNIDT